MAAAQSGQFDVVLVDDLSRLARDNDLMLSVIAELHFEGVRVVSVADGLDSEDEKATLGIQIRGIFNELQLRDLDLERRDGRGRLPRECHRLLERVGDVRLGQHLLDGDGVRALHVKHVGHRHDAGHAQHLTGVISVRTRIDDHETAPAGLVLTHQ